MTGIYTLKNARIGYRDRSVISSLSLSIKKGRLVALIGPNGSGKSTLLKACSGFLPYGGSITLSGREVSGISRASMGRLLGIASQQAVFRADFTVRDVISLGRLPHQGLFSRAGSEDHEAVLYAARLLGVEKFLSRSVRELSGGERQRVQLAILAAQDAPVWLLDEPTSAMDPRQALRTFALLKDQAARGRTVITAVHDISAALAYADDCVALRNGSLVSFRPASEMDGDILESLYDISFTPYYSPGGDRTWFPSLISAKDSSWER